MRIEASALAKAAGIGLLVIVALNALNLLVQPDVPEGLTVATAAVAIIGAAITYALYAGFGALYAVFSTHHLSTQEGAVGGALTGGLVAILAAAVSAAALMLFGDTSLIEQAAAQNETALVIGTVASAGGTRVRSAGLAALGGALVASINEYQQAEPA
ncbi:MAG: hypothetical protein ACFB51_10925 [Anaerolineae bacterium]